ncbi:MAG: GNAT family N-acetyltransferase [Prevotella sp.]|nr:GNAT family N-acetyltransferase [Prevotella sp.]
MAAHRQSGLGRLLMNNVYKEAKKRRAKVLRLEGRLRAKGFYEKMGYTVCYAPFDEAGLPHVKMERHID